MPPPSAVLQRSGVRGPAHPGDRSGHLRRVGASRGTGAEGPARLATSKWGWLVVNEVLDLSENEQVTVTLLANPLDWRVRVVEEITLDAAATCLRRRSLQV